MSRNYTVLLAVVLGAALVVGGVAVADLGSQPATASSHDDPGGSSIQVSASGSSSAQPDKVVVRLAVEATADNASVAREQVAENISSVRSALMDLGLSEEQIRTDGYNLYQDERRVPREERTEERVYRVSHRLTIDVENVESAGEVIDTAIANGANNIYDVQFALEDSTREELRSEALSNAMGSARQKAETLAASENLTIANVDSIMTTERGFSPYEDAARAATATAGGSADTDIGTGPVSVSASVQVTYNATG